MFLRILFLGLWCCFTASAQVGESSSNQSDVPVFDPAQETVTFLGQTFRLQDSRIGAHFESYLSSRAHQTADAQRYQKNIALIQKILQQGSGYNNKVKSATLLLKETAKYDGDHNVSESLGVAVYSALLAKQTIRDRDEKILRLREEKGKILRNMEFVATRTDLDTRRKVGEKRKPNSGKQKSSAKYLELQRRRVEIELLIKKNQGLGVLQLAQSKVEFQAILIQLFAQRRFEHVVIGCRFYINIFKPTDSKLKFKRGSTVADFFNKAVGVTPTIAGLESFTLEIIAKVRALVNMTENHLTFDQLHAASNRLLEAYAVGEHLTYIQALPNELKQKVYQYTQVSNNLMDAIEARNFQLAKELNMKLKEMAEDYRYTKMEAYIEGYTKASNHHAIQAYTHMSRGEKDLMFQEIENARVLWPTNPKLKDIAKIIDEELDSERQRHLSYENCSKEFDQMVLDRKFMTLLKEENWLLYATQFNIHDDLERIDQLHEIADRHKPIIEGLKACQLMAEKHPNRAWEHCSSLHRKYPEIDEVTLALSQYRQQAFRFVTLIEQAQKHTQNGNLGSAMSHYLEAKNLFRQSKEAQAGIAYLTKLRDQ